MTIMWGIRLGRKYVDAIVAAMLPMAVWLLYRKVLRLWWTYDDAYLLHIAATHSPRQYFVDPNVWREMPQHLFTPLLTIAYDAELSLFGFFARGYYGMQVALLALSTLALYAVLRLYVVRRYAFAGALLFASGVPLCTLATELMLVHYGLAILLGIISTVLYVLSVRSTPQPISAPREGIIDVLPERDVRLQFLRAVLSLASAVVFLLAMLAKEVAVPLVLVLPMLPDRDLRTRVRYAIPHAGALVVYLVWRTRMLGELLGGYGWAITPGELPRLVLTLPFSIIRVFAGPGSPAGVLLIAVTAIGILGLGKRRGGLATAVAALAFSIYPVLPVSKEIQPRFGIVAWLCWSVLFVAGTWTLRQHGARISTASLLLAAAVLGLVVNREGFRQVFNASREMSDEAHFFVDAPPDALLCRPAIPPGSIGELQWLKSDPLHHSGGALCIYDEIYLCSGREGRRIFGYDQGRRQVRDITTQANIDAARFCGRIRSDVSLQTTFSYREGSLFWRLGPYREGKYRFVLANGLQAYDMAAVDGFRLGNLPGIALRVRYDSPAGWTTYSPEFSLDFVRHPDFSWHR